jgi:predicted dehydrogenase
MEQSKRHRIGVVGLGLRLGMLLRAAKVEGWQFDIVGYVDPDPVGAAVLAEAGADIGKPFDSVSKLLSEGALDLVMIGSPNHLHLAHLKEALGFKTPIFIEKPIVRTQEETMELARLLRGRDMSKIFVGLVARSAPVVRTALRKLEEGVIGEIVSIDATEHLPPVHGEYLARNWRRRVEWGGSFLLDKVCHDFDILGQMIKARATRVSSFGGRRIFVPGRANQIRRDGPPVLKRFAGWNAASDASGADMDVTDHQVAILEYANGVRLSFHSNTCSPVPERRWQVIGAEGVLTVDLVGHALEVVAQDRSRPVERIQWRGPPGDSHGGADQAMVHDLVAALDGRAPFPVSVEDSMVAGLTVMAIDEAADSGTVIDCTGVWSQFDQNRALDAVG